MPPASKPKGGASAFLTRKLGPFPMWVWLTLGTVVTWYVFKRVGSGNAAAATTQSPVSQPATDTTGLSGGAGTSGDMTGAGVAGVNPSDLLGSLGAQNAALQSSLLQSESAFEQLASSGYGYQPAGVASNVSPSITSTSTQPGGSNAPTFHYTPVSASAPNFAKAAVAQSTAARKTGATSAFGGVTSVTKNAKTGVVVTKYASGRVVEQAPGKTAYVARR